MSAPIDLRIAVATLAGAAATLLLTPVAIRLLRARGAVERPRSDAPPHHHSKAGTVTMGGLVVVGAAICVTGLTTDLRNPALWPALVATLGFGVIGFVDDCAKVRGRSGRGLSHRAKGIPQLLVAAAVVLIPDPAVLGAPTEWPWPAFEFAALVFLSNAVNLSDGIDGLAATLVTIAAAGVGWSIYVSASDAARELAVFCAAAAGASLGFLRFNWHPARVFMGDVGSLALGAGLTTVTLTGGAATMSLAIMGVFLIESLTSAAQAIWMKATGRDLLRMAPLHHHFELLGWSEPRIVRWFAAAALLLAAAAVLTGR